MRHEETGWEWERKVVSGGAGGTRTPYLFNAIEALSQMSYSPMQIDRPRNRLTVSEYSRPTRPPQSALPVHRTLRALAETRPSPPCPACVRPCPPLPATGAP